jgi:mRNA interferase YafQ
MSSFLDILNDENTKYALVVTAQFKREYKLARKRGFDPNRLAEIVTLLANGIPLPEKNRDHALSGDWIGYRECHILPDWLLIYRLEEDILVLTLTRTGTHSDLFQN